MKGIENLARGLESIRHRAASSVRDYEVMKVVIQEQRSRRIARAKSQESLQGMYPAVS